MSYAIANKILIPYLRKKVKKVEGVENIPRDTNFIMASNHWTTADSFFITSIILLHTKIKLYYIAANNVCPSILRPVFGRLFRLVFKSDKKPAECLVPSKKLLEQGNGIGIFPEGRLKKKGLIKAKTGVARLHLWTKRPILPVGFIGAKVIQKKNPINLMRVIFAKERPEIFIGKPMSFPEYFDKEVTKEILEEITRKIMQEIALLIGQEYKH